MNDQQPETPVLASADVVVVGGGGSGLAAAVSAAERGRSVILLEKGDRPGGTTRISVGSISVNRSPFQQAQGIEDSPQAHFEDLGLLAGDRAETDNLELRRLLTEEVTDTFAWLQGHGVEFYGPFEEPPHRVPRMHMVLPNSGVYVQRLLRAARRLGVRVHTRASLEELVVRDGRVVGVRITKTDEPGRQGLVLASRGVVLATGDFSGSDELKRQHLTPAAAAARPINPNSTGDGHLAALEVDAHLRNADLALGPQLRFAPPPNPLWVERVPNWRLVARIGRFGLERLPAPLTARIMTQFLTTYMSPTMKLFDAGAALVTEDGRRCPGELSDPAGALAASGRDRAWIVFGSDVAEQFQAWPGFISTAPGVAYAYLDDYLRMRPDVTTRADTIEELATAVGLPVAALASSLHDHAASHGARRALRGPFYALGPVTSWVVLTDGGLAVDTSLRVLDTDGMPIPGLYGAGSTGQGGLVLHGHGHHIGWAFVSGRTAGRSVADNPAHD